MSSGGPLPPTTQWISASRVAMRRTVNPGKRALSAKLIGVTPIPAPEPPDSVRGSVDLRTGFPHNVGPLDDLGLDHRGEFLGRISDRLRTEPDELFLHVGHVEDLDDLDVEALDDFGWRARRREHALPRAYFESREPGFGERRNVRRCRPSLRGRDGESPKRARFCERPRRRDVVEGHRYLTADDILQRRGAAL